MATFDQLPAEQRAIIELVVTRGRSYDALADVLQVSASRVRELARDALVELSPVSGGRVDAQWRSQVADYVLGQQSDAESTATRAHLKRSEPARTWALSLLDSLDTLYADGDRPEIPEAEDAGRRGGGAGPAVAVADGDGEERAEEEAERSRGRRRERAERDRKPAAAEAEKRAEREEKGARDKTPSAKAAALSPAAQAALRRRRITSAIVGLVVLAGVVLGILALTGVFSSDSKSTTASGSGGGTGTGSTTTPTGQPTQVLGQIALQPLNGAKAQGVAYILKQGSKQVLAVTAKLPPLPATQRKAAYNVWLFNAPKDAYSIGAQFTTAQGDYQGVGALPANWQRYKFVDVSIQPFNRTTAHSGNSILRGAFANLKPVPQNQQGGASTGTGTTPTP